MSATLGGLIKDYRLQKNIAQLEVAYKIGWKDATILSRIEQGIIRDPSRSVIDKISEALTLEDEDKNYLLLIGGYQPTAEEVRIIREKTEPIISQYRFPAFVQDFSWRIIHENEPAKHLEYIDDEESKWVDEELPNALEFNFRKDYFEEKFIDSENKQEFLTYITAQYLYEQRGWVNRKWYKDSMKNLIKNPDFKPIYKKALKIHPDKLILDYTTQIVKHRRKPELKLSFFIFNVPLFLDRRLFIEYQIPADADTYLYYENNSA